MKLQYFTQFNNNVFNGANAETHTKDSNPYVNYKIIFCHKNLLDNK